MASGPTITAKFLADTKDLTSGVDDATSKAGSKMDGFAKTAALAVGGAFAVGAVVDFGKAAVEAAAADEEAQAQLALALKNTAGATDAQVAAAEDYISTLSKQTALADDDLRPALGKLALGFGDAEEAQKALAIATDVSAGTGKDLATVTDAMMKAAQGNTGALKKMGVETKNADGSAKSLDQIMADMATTFEGQAATAAESTAGQMRGAEIAMGELQETIGAALLPVIGDLATLFTGTLLPAVEDVVGWIIDNKDLFLALGIALGTVGVVILASLVPAFLTWAVAAGAAAAATLLAAAPLILVGAAVAALAFVVIKNWDTIKDTTEKVFKAVTDAVKAAFDWVKDNWPLLLAIITGPIGLAVLAVSRHWDTIKQGASDVWSWVVDKFNAIRDGISGVIGGIGTAISSIVTELKKPIAAATEVYEWIRDKFDAILDKLRGVRDTIGGIVTSIADKIKAPINAVIDAWNGIAFQVPTFTLPKVDLGPLGSIGGGSYGGQRFDFPNVPRLATGGVLTSATLFLGGEAGTEIVTPEALMRQIIREEGGGAGYTLNIYPRRADASDIAYGFRRLELMAGVA